MNSNTKNDSLETSIRYIKGVGEAREKLMNKLGIFTLRDLVGYFPRAYEDRTKISKINELAHGEKACVRAMVAETPKLTRISKGREIVKLRAVDEAGTLEIVFFNSAYVKNVLKSGQTYIFYGKVEGTLLKPSMINPLFEEEGKVGITTGLIVPIYGLTAKLSQSGIATAVRNSLDICADELPDVLPDSIASQFELSRARYAYENIHFPTDFTALNLARKRLIFEELFVLSTAMKVLREGRAEKTGTALTMPDFDEFYQALSFKPTGAQISAIEDAAKDLTGNKPMSRLIQGDVGSGKTLVAAACCWMTHRSGYQSAFMAPTEILAKQHFATLSNLLEPLGMRVALLTGSMTAKTKRETYGQLNLGEIDLIIGTHALISEGVHFHELGLVITDEQHRFGVNQRSMLTEKGDSPHVLVMSATPIPRTLALIIYGDLDVSIIDEMPPGRKEIETHIIDERHRKRVYGFVEKLVGEGRQVYIICPMVDEAEVDEWGGGTVPLPQFDKHITQTHANTNGAEEPSPRPTLALKAAVEYHKALQEEVFPNLRVELVHGKMHTKKKDAAMNAFASGEADILVATTVVEVGVDVSNAALIIIENADRFGLSQLHQLRGRVGRGEHESYCVLVNSTSTGAGKERLNIMKSTGDGFKIAEEDLKLRGPGDFFGSRQHGLPEMRIANLATDMKILTEAQNAAEELLKSDPKLEAPENRKLAEQITRLFTINADKLN